jgi:UDP-glucose 4-epimerase
VTESWPAYSRFNRRSSLSPVSLTATVALPSGIRAPTSGSDTARWSNARKNDGGIGTRTALITSTSSRAGAATAPSKPVTVLPVRILVTGGAGFIGSHVVDAYIAAGHEVAVLDNFSTGSENNVNQAAAVHRVDLRDESQVENAVASFRPELVNHHAAQSEVPRSVADPTYDAQVNIIGGLNLLKASVDHHVRKVVFSSTGGALYGEPDVVPADEDHPVRPLSPYGTSKFAFEQYLGTFRRTFGLDFTVLRYANIYGPRQDFHAEEGRVIALFASRMLEGRPVTIDGTGEQSRDMLHIGDVAAANVAALEKGSGGTFHVSTGIATTVNDLYRKLALLTGYRLEPKYGPARKGDVYRIALDNERARLNLGWEPRVTLEEGLSLTVDYFREQVPGPQQ